MKQLSGYDVFLLYLALKSHFHNERYDYFRFKGRVRAGRETFLRRKDRYFFEKLAKRFSGDRAPDLVGYFVSNFTLDESLWIGDALSEDAERHFLEWQGRIQSLDYVFQSDCETLLLHIEKKGISFNSVFECPPREHPILLKLLLNKALCLETFIILNRMLRFFARWSKSMPEDYIWQEVRLRCEKYEPFLPQLKDSHKKHQGIVRKKLTEHGLFNGA